MVAGAKIGAVARAAGVSVQAIRYYERAGLLARPPRTPAGYRIYSPEASVRLHFIKQAQGLGFSLQEIKEILRLRYECQSPCQCVRGLLEAKLERVEGQMGELRRFRRELRKTLAYVQRRPRVPHRSSAICPIIESRRAKRTNAGGEKR